MEFPRQEYWSGKPFPTPGGLPHPGIEPRSPVLQADSLPNLLEMCVYEPSPRHSRVGCPAVVLEDAFQGIPMHPET